MAQVLKSRLFVGDVRGRLGTSYRGGFLRLNWRIVIFHDTANGSLKKLLTPASIAAVERDRFVSHLYQARREYRWTCETAGQSASRAS